MDKAELRKHAEALSGDALACIKAVLTKHNMGLIEAAHEHGQQLRAANTGPLAWTCSPTQSAADRRRRSDWRAEFCSAPQQRRNDDA